MNAKPPALNIIKGKAPGSRTALDSPIDQISQKILAPALLSDETLDIIVLDSELDLKIAKVLNEKAADSTNIRQKVVNQVNQLFPTEESISGSDSVLDKLKLQIQNLEQELRGLILTRQEKNTPEIINQIKKEIQDLVKKIHIIKAKASQCEKTVVEITRDIKSLDGTKTNISSVMGLIKRIHLTVNALEYMKGMANRKQYGNVAEVLRITVKVYSPLKEYKTNPQIVTLCENMMAFENEVKKSIFNEFEGAFNGGTIALQADTLNESCGVLEFLEMDAKNQLIRWYVEMQLADYRNLFRKNPEVAGLIDISRRYAWLKRSLKTFDEHHAVLFPERWKVADSLSWHFCQDTKRDLAEVIMKSERDGSFDTKVMLGAIQTTTEFEGKLHHRFIEQVYKEETNGADDMDRYNRIISSVFDSFLWHYIDMEDQVMTEKFETFRRSLGEVEEGVYGTSLELFLFYRQTFASCVKLSTGKPFLDLCKMYQKWLERYKELLGSKIPKDDRKVPNIEDLLMICSILNTSDYCGITAGQLEEKLIDTINKEFKGLISFVAEVEAFASLTGSALITLVHGVENMLDAALILMTKKSWATMATVGDQSEHITAIAQSLSSIIPIIRKQLTSPKFFKSFCDKFVESFLSKFLNNITTRCKPLCEVGAEQMLLDTHSLNNILIAMTNHGAEEKAPPSASFTKILGKGIAKIDQLLKVVLRPLEPAGAIIDTYMLLFQDHSASGFQKILELKGVRRIEMNAILEQYSQRQTPTIIIGSSSTSSPSAPKTFSTNFFSRATVNTTK